jgi:hypothetical protein
MGAMTHFVRFFMIPEAGRRYAVYEADKPPVKNILCPGVRRVAVQNATPGLNRSEQSEGRERFDGLCGGAIPRLPRERVTGVEPATLCLARLSAASLSPAEPRSAHDFPHVKPATTG